MSRADEFTQGAVRLIREALEVAAQQQEAKAAGLPREYRTGVVTADLRARENAVRRAAEFRAAIPSVQALFNRSQALRASTPEGETR